MPSSYHPLHDKYSPTTAKCHDMNTINNNTHFHFHRSRLTITPGHFWTSPLGLASEFHVFPTWNWQKFQSPRGFGDENNTRKEVSWNHFQAWSISEWKGIQRMNMERHVLSWWCMTWYPNWIYIYMSIHREGIRNKCHSIRSETSEVQLTPRKMTILKGKQSSNHHVFSGCVICDMFVLYSVCVIHSNIPCSLLKIIQSIGISLTNNWL